MTGYTDAADSRLALDRPSRDLLALAAWAVLVLGCAAWGLVLLERGTGLFINAPPLFGSWEVRITPGVVAPLALAAVIATAGPLLARRLSWRWLLATVIAAAAAWPLALALTAGPETISSPLADQHDYLTVVGSIDSPGSFVSSFIDRIDSFATHVSSHPPGMPLILFGLAGLGLGGPTAAAVLVVAVAATAPAAALVAARAIAGAPAARRAAPFLVLAPAAVWIATSADALFMGIGAWAVALVVLAIAERRRSRSAGFAIAGGLALGITCFLSFGLVLLATIPLAVALARRRFGPLLVAASAAGVVFAVFLAAGYWWLDGLAAARGQYYDGVASTRPFGYFVVANLAAFAIATGPALALALGRLRDPRLWILVGGVAAAIAFADLSGMSKAEVERIWLPFVPWALLACAALPGKLGAQRALLGAQAGFAMALQIALETNW